MSVHWVKADIAIGSPRSDFDPRVRPLRRGGLGVVKSLGDLSSGPVVLLHTQKLELNTKSPTATDHDQGDAIGMGRKPGMPLSILSNIAREAPLGSLSVAFLLGVAVARR